jgi:hypothetical protein
MNAERTFREVTGLWGAGGLSFSIHHSSLIIPR